MPFKYFEETAKSDMAFEAWGSTIEEMFIAAADAMVNVMVLDLTSIAGAETRIIETSSESIDMLLYNFLEEILFYKDAEQLLLRVPIVQIAYEDENFVLEAEAYGEQINPLRHELTVDVKAVTPYRFEVRQTPTGWHTTVMLDV